MNFIDRLDKFFTSKPSEAKQDEAEEGIMNMEEAPPPMGASPATVAVSTGVDDRTQISNLTDSINIPNNENLFFRRENVSALHSLTELHQSKSQSETSASASSKGKEDADKDENQDKERRSNDITGGSPRPYETASTILLNDQELGKFGRKGEEAQPYKKEIFEQKLEQLPPGMERRAAILATLRQLGVKVYVIDASTPLSTQEILRKVCLVTGVVAKENTIEPWTGPLGYLRCILYQDSNGRLFNLTLSEHTIGPLSRWREYLDTFSCTQAIVALMVLCRSFPCSTEGKNASNLTPLSTLLLLNSNAANPGRKRYGREPQACLSVSHSWFGASGRDWSLRTQCCHVSASSAIALGALFDVASRPRHVAQGHHLSFGYSGCSVRQSPTHYDSGWY